MSEIQVREKVFEMVKAVCVAAGSDVEIDSETRLGDLSVDSLKLVEVIFELEMIFVVEADEELLSQLETVEDIVEMFENSLRAECVKA
jgi:acyl carrier protein